MIVTEVAQKTENTTLDGRPTEKNFYLVPIHEKYSLTVSQAAEYFGIGEKKLRKIMDDNISADFLLHNGSRVTIKRKKFEQFLDRTSSI